VRSVGHIVRSDASGARNIDALYFYARVGLVWIPKKDGRTRHTKLVVRYVHPGHETSTRYFSCLGGFDVGRTKSTPGHVTTN
jgi:hypothetical protein